MMWKLAHTTTTHTDRTVSTARDVLEGRHSGIGSYIPFLGPAVIASIAYLDPGNFATNIQAGAQTGYMLVWVVVVANLIAMLFQSLSAKLGIVTGKSLAEMSRDTFHPVAVYGMWIASEIAAMATDVAEVLGGALGLSLLFHIPLFVGIAITGVVTYLVLLTQGKGFRPIEIIISIFMGIISMSYLIEVWIVPHDWPRLFHSFAPMQLIGSDAVLLAVGIVGATVMPHAIYLHSSLTKDRIPTYTDGEKKRVLRFSNHEVLFTLAVAGLVNIAMVMLAASAFHFTGMTTVAEIATAYHTLIPLFGVGAAVVFLVSLLASGFSSSIVGTMAGQVIMQDFVHITIPVWVRRIITLLPAFVVTMLWSDVTQILVVSQVVLSMVLPIPMIALIVLTARRSIMGNFVNSRFTTVISVCAGALVLVLNGILLAHVAGWWG